MFMVIQLVSLVRKIFVDLSSLVFVNSLFSRVVVWSRDMLVLQVGSEGNTWAANTSSNCPGGSRYRPRAKKDKNKYEQILFLQRDAINREG
ncbi:MAG TPA: hypothetical protein GXX58_03850 [Gelria sp.]|nr:hypothetical protein [Gelria sp.]